MRNVKMCFRLSRDVISAIYIFFSVGFVVMTTTYLFRQRGDNFVSNHDISDKQAAMLLRAKVQHSELYKTKAPDIINKTFNENGKKSNINSKIDELNDAVFISKTPEFRQYVTLRKTRVNPNDYKFNISGRSICKTPPYLIIVCLSKIINMEERAAIRETWGNWSYDEFLSTSLTASSAKLVFMFGSPGNSFALRKIAFTESKQYGDVVMADFEDTYENLTRKVLTTLKWTSKYCQGAKFLLKVDDDTFVHVPNLINFLIALKVSNNGIIIGHAEFKHAVLRSGKWTLPYDVYPLDEYPPYISGNSYVISVNILSALYQAAEYLPFIYIEDVFITGIVREAIGADMQHRAGFTWWTERFPRLCGFHNKDRISATNVNVKLMRQLWQALHLNLTNCYDSTTLQKQEFVSLWPQK